MSITGGKGGGKSKYSNQETATQTLDPRLSSTLYDNIGRAQQLAGRAYTPLSGQQIAQYQNPYQEQVIDNTITDWNRGRQIAANGVADKYQRAGAFGGTREAVAQGVAQGEAERTLGSLIANLNAQGFAQALQTAQAENQQANQYPLLLQQLLNQSVGLIPNHGTTNSTGSGVQKGKNWNFGFEYTPQASSMPMPGGLPMPPVG